METLKNNIFLKQKFSTKESVMKAIGNLMLKKGVADEKYVNSFEARDKASSVAIGNYLALVHGTYESSINLKDQFICFIELKDAIDWNGQPVKFVIGLAVAGDKQMDVLSNIAEVFSDSNLVEKLYNGIDKEEILKLLEN